MKKTGTLNARLSRIIASMGHGDRLVICDAGLPIPRGSEVVDLALRPGVPRFIETLSTVLEELEVESAVIADEMKGNGVHDGLTALLNGIPVSSVSHDDFRGMTRENGNIAFVRTGETTAYANVILVSGVTFG